MGSNVAQLRTYYEKAGKRDPPPVRSVRGRLHQWFKDEEGSGISLYIQLPPIPFELDATIRLQAKAKRERWEAAPAPQESSAAIDHIIFMAVSMGVARCRADQVAAEDLILMSSASRRLRAECLRAFECMEMEAVSKSRDALVEELESCPDTINIASEICALAETLFSGSPLFCFTTAQLQLRCDGTLACTSAAPDYMPIACTGIELSVAVLKFSRGVKLMCDWIQSWFESQYTRSDVLTYCPTGGGCEVCNMRYTVPIDRLPPLFWVRLEPCAEAGTGRMLEGVNWTVLRALEGFRDVHFNVQWCKDGALVPVCVYYTLDMIWIWRDCTGTYLTRLVRNGKVYEYPVAPNESGYVGKCRSWYDGLAQGDRVVALFYRVRLD